MRLSTIFTRLAAAATGLTAATAAVAQDLPVIGAPVDRQTGFQTAATELMSDIRWLDGFLLIIITVVIK